MEGNTTRSLGHVIPHLWNGQLLTLKQYLQQKLPSIQFPFHIRPVASPPNLIPVYVGTFDPFPNIEAFITSPNNETKPLYKPMDVVEIRLRKVHPDCSEEEMASLFSIILEFVGCAILSNEVDFLVSLEQIVSSSIKDHQPQETASSKVLAKGCEERSDVLLKLGNQPFLVAVMKFPGFFRSSLSDEPPNLAFEYYRLMGLKDEDPTIAYGILELYTCLVNLELGYGILSTVDLTYFVIREENSIKISKGIQWKDERLLGALSYFIDTAAKADREEFKKGRHGKLTSLSSYYSLTSSLIIS
jgi:hypothetical protein